jgi:5-oxoprolinase (ATP-hydrolysing) subunit A
MKMDLNSDIGESYGIYTIGQDADLMPSLTSANIACGFHGGDPLVMQRTVALCKAHKVGVGAHPGYPDLAGFGRRVIKMNDAEIESMMLYQLGALAAFCRAQGVPLRHVKPHGALYNHAAQDLPTARAIARAITRFDSQLILVGLANSLLIDAAHEFGLPVAREGFIDRAYRNDGSLVPRSEAGAVMSSPARAVQVTIQLVREGTVRTNEGKLLKLDVDTLCIHGDTPHAADIARAVHEALKAANVELKPMLAD